MPVQKKPAASRNAKAQMKKSTSRDRKTRAKAAKARYNVKQRAKKNLNYKPRNKHLQRFATCVREEAGLARRQSTRAIKIAREAKNIAQVASGDVEMLKTELARHAHWIHDWDERTGYETPPRR